MVVASGLFNADSQSLHLEAPGGDVGQSDDLLADIRLQSMKQVFSLLWPIDGQGELGTQLVKVCHEAADRLAWCLAGFEILLLDLDVPHDGKPELFEEKVSKLFSYGVVNALVVLALVSRILNIVEGISSGIYDP